MSALIVNESSTVRAASRLASATAPDGRETVIVDPTSGRYFGLDAHAVVVWSLIQRPRRVSDLLDAVMAEYDVEREVLWEDVRALLRELADAGLVEVDDRA